SPSPRQVLGRGRIETSTLEEAPGTTIGRSRGAWYPPVRNCEPNIGDWMKRAMEMPSLWKPQNGSHRDLEISHRTGDSHIPTARTLFLLRKRKSGQITCQTEADSSLVNNTTGRSRLPIA